ncbi:universal stress protein [Sphingopyxis fribergensis]
MKTIVLLVHDDEGQDARLETALAITRALGGHLACVDVIPSPVIAGDLYVGFGEAAIVSDGRAGEARTQAAVSTRLSREDIEWSWTDATGDIAGRVAAAAGLADLIILSRALDVHHVPDMRAIVTQILFRSHAPVVAVPPVLDRFELDRALVAWDGRASSAAALRASVPLLSLAKAVEVFTARNGDAGADPADAAAYLSRYGIRAETRITARGSRRASACIVAESERWRADYIVMGAYGRGRWRETLGGVTRKMLASSAVPLLLSH